jgi:ribosomal protein L37E
MTREELNQLLAKSKAASNARDRRLQLVFGGLMALGFAPLGAYLLIGKLSKAIVLPYMGLVVVGFVALALYVLFTSRAFQHRTEAKCPRCGAPLGWVWRVLKIEAFGGYATSEAIRCKSCGELLLHVRPRL